MDFTSLLPEPLRSPGPLGLVWGQWLAVPIALAVAWILGIALGRLTRVVLGAVVKRTGVGWGERMLEALHGPIVWLWTVGAATVLLGELDLPARVLALMERVLRSAALLMVFWMLLRLVAMAGGAVTSSPLAAVHPAIRSLVPLGVSIGRVAVAAIAVIALLADLGYPVASLVAGLGIGGLAVALAAQKTVENLFGAFSIGVDQPFAVGDTIRVESVEGTVENIGLRSTRIRTAERTLVTIPNGKLAELRVESLSARDRLRFACVLGLDYGTPAAGVRAVLAGVEAALRAHPRLWQDDFVVRLRDLGAQALEVEVAAWFQTTKLGELRAIREQMLLAFMEAVEKAGATFAARPGTVVAPPGPR
jgi:MscS family membrane protein